MTETHISYTGDGVRYSIPLKQDVHLHRLEAHGVPVLKHARDLAEAAGITLNELRFLCHSDRISQVNHYHTFTVAKKTGGERQITAPLKRIKRLQHWILQHILSPLPVADEVHGFTTGRHILSNAQRHCGQPVVVNMDLQDFFGTIHYKQIKRVFRWIGYGWEVTNLLASLCSSAAKAKLLDEDKQVYFIEIGGRVLPQGAPTSPAISNHVCWKLDKRLRGLAHKYGFVYTRYADDLSFSGTTHRLGALLECAPGIIRDEGFSVHPQKTRVMRQGHRQEVTGLVVNETPHMCRKTLKRFRALLFQWETKGFSELHWHGYTSKSPRFIAVLRGFASAVCLTEPEKGRVFLSKIEKLSQFPNHQGTVTSHEPQNKNVSIVSEQPHYYIPSRKVSVFALETYHLFLDMLHKHAQRFSFETIQPVLQQVLLGSSRRAKQKVYAYLEKVVQRDAASSRSVCDFLKNTACCSIWDKHQRLNIRFTALKKYRVDSGLSQIEKIAP